MVTIFSSI